MTDFKHKTAIITGGADGIGKALALNLIAQGAKVVVTDIDRSKLSTLAEAVEADGNRATFELLDVTDETAVQQLVADVKDEFWSHRLYLQ